MGPASSARNVEGLSVETGKASITSGAPHEINEASKKIEALHDVQF